jgi:hypothetical protein
MPAITNAARGAVGEHGHALAGITHAYLTTRQTITARIKTLTAQISQALTVHPDRDIFTALPRARTIRAARPLAEIGDARGRFPTADSLACLAGAAPPTRESGKARIVAFRWTVDKQLRDAVCDFAADSRHANAWAAHLDTQARARGHDHPPRRTHRRPRLAQHHLKVLDHQHPYHPAHHGALQRLTKQDQQTAAWHRATHRHPAPWFQSIELRLPEVHGEADHLRRRPCRGPPAVGRLYEQSGT